MNVIDRSVFIFKLSGQVLVRNPAIFVAFLVAGVLVVSSQLSLLLYREAFVAAASMLFPSFFERRIAIAPREHLYLPAIVLLTLVTLLWVLVWSMLTVRLADSALHERSQSLGAEFARTLRLVPRGIALSVVLGVLIGAGTALFLLPGFYLAVRLFVALPALAIDGRSIVEAIRESWRRTQGVEGPTAIVLLALVIAWFLLANVPASGSLLAFSLVLPLFLVASTIVYRLGGASERARGVDFEHLEHLRS